MTHDPEKTSPAATPSASTPISAAADAAAMVPKFVSMINCRLAKDHLALDLLFGGPSPNPVVYVGCIVLTLDHAARLRDLLDRQLLEHSKYLASLEAGSEPNAASSGKTATKQGQKKTKKKSARRRMAPQRAKKRGRK